MAVIAVSAEDSSPLGRNRIRKVKWDGTTGNATTEQVITGKLLAIRCVSADADYTVTLSDDAGVTLYTVANHNATDDIVTVSFSTTVYLPIPVNSTIKCTLADAAATVGITLYYEVY